MTTLEEVLKIQKQYGVLQAPRQTDSISASSVEIARTVSTLNICLRNNTSSWDCWAYVTGLDINRNNAVFILESDGVTPYYPTSPSDILQPLRANCHIQLGGPGSYRIVTIPQLAGGRIWLCRDSQLVFKLNPGPAVVEPSVTNPGDPNYNLFWSFAEFTFNSFQLFANITYVDFVGEAIALTLENTSGQIQNVPGIPSNGLDAVCAKLQEQDARDGAGWGKLIVRHPSGKNLRALSPNAGIVMNNSLFEGYFQPYVDAVWAKYSSSSLAVDTQNRWGVVTGRVANGQLSFPGTGAFPQPSSRDIFSCNSGAFGDYPNNREEMGNLAARISAAFNRSTLLINSNQPMGERIGNYYCDPITNHYSRIVHEVTPDGKGYAFPYDDVAADDAQNVAGTVADGNPKLFTVSFGGPTPAAVKRVTMIPVSNMARSGGHKNQRIGGRGLEGHSPVPWTEDKKVTTLDAFDHDPEQGLHNGKVGLPVTAYGNYTLHGLIPNAVQTSVERAMRRIENSGVYSNGYIRPAVDAVLRAGEDLLSLSVRQLVGRAVVVLCLVLGSLMLGLLGRTRGAVGDGEGY